MESGVSKSMFTLKNTRGFMRPRYSPAIKWGIIWNYFHIFLDVETVFTLLGFQVLLLCIFIHLPDTTVYISVDNTWMKNKLWHDLHRDFILVYLNKRHIRVVSTKIWIVDFHGVHTF